ERFPPRTRRGARDLPNDTAAAASPSPRPARVSVKLPACARRRRDGQPTRTGGRSAEESDDEALSFPVTQPAEGHVRAEGIGARLRNRAARRRERRTAPAR